MIWVILAQIVFLFIFGWWGLLFIPIVVLIVLLPTLNEKQNKTTPTHGAITRIEPNFNSYNHPTDKKHRFEKTPYNKQKEKTKTFHSTHNTSRLPYLDRLNTSSNSQMNGSVRVNISEFLDKFMKYASIPDTLFWELSDKESRGCATHEL